MKPFSTLLALAVLLASGAAGATTLPEPFHDASFLPAYQRFLITVPENQSAFAHGSMFRKLSASSVPSADKAEDIALAYAQKQLIIPEVTPLRRPGANTRLLLNGDELRWEVTIIGEGQHIPLGRIIVEQDGNAFSQAGY